MASETTADEEKWPIVAQGDGFTIDGPSLPERATDEATRHAKYAYYDATRLPDGARIGYVWRYSTDAARDPDHAYRYGTYAEPDDAVKAAYNEQDGTMYEFISCLCHAYADADADISDHELFEDALQDIRIEGDETFRLWIEIEEHEQDYLGDRMVRCDHITVKADSESDAADKAYARTKGVGDLEPCVARKFDHYDIESETLQDPDMDAPYVWVHTEAGSDDFKILGRERGDL